MIPAHRQVDARVRLDWGAAGGIAIAESVDVVVVVDVLSFTTTVTVAMDAGMTIVPFRWGDDAAAELYARRHDAVLAVGRSRTAAGQPSLSPASIGHAPTPARLVLPSPNGSTIAYELADHAATCLAASLRNASAVASWITERHDRVATTVAVIAAGERWPDGNLRPAAEDLWGAGAVIAGILAAGWTGLSPEAAAAHAAYQAVRDRLDAELRACASGQELVADGFATDVDIAAELDQSAAVPRLVDGCFIAG